MNELFSPAGLASRVRWWRFLTQGRSPSYQEYGVPFLTKILNENICLLFRFFNTLYQIFKCFYKFFYILSENLDDKPKLYRPCQNILSHDLRTFSKSIYFLNSYILCNNSIYVSDISFQILLYFLKIYVLSRKIYILSLNPYILSEKIYILSQNPYTLWKLHTLSNQNPYTFSKSIYTLLQNKRGRGFMGAPPPLIWEPMTWHRHNYTSS